MMIKRFRILFCFFFLLFSFERGFCNDWVLGGMEFSFKQPKSIPENQRQAASTLSRLILERISSGGVRTLPETENLDRKLKELQTERLSLFLQLSKECQARDSLVLTTLSRYKLNRLIKESDSKISDIQKKIAENLKASEEEFNKSSERIQIEKNGIKNGHDSKKDSVFLNFPFFEKNQKNEIHQENVVLYKSDSSSLFVPSDGAFLQGYTSWDFEKEVTQAKINGLLTGMITTYGDYCSVTVDLRVYPGSKIAGSITEVGMISDLIPLANRIARSMASIIANSLPVMLEFDIEPEEALQESIVTVDGVVQEMLSKSRDNNNSDNKVLVEAGIHTIVIQSKGYNTVSVVQTFVNENVFTIKAVLEPEIHNKINIRLKKYKDGIFYVNGLESAEVNPESVYGTITVNGKTSLGVFKAIEKSPDVEEKKDIQKKDESVSEKSNGKAEDEVKITEAEEKISPDKEIASNNENKSEETASDKSVAEKLESDSEQNIQSEENKQKSKDKKKLITFKSSALEPKPESNIAFFRLPEHYAFDGAYLLVNSKPYDRAANIDKRRRSMYLAYTAVICSLPFTFYSIGRFTAENNANKLLNPRTSFDTVTEWQKKSYTALGITSVFGAWAVIELVRYLYAVDKVLPVNAKIDKKAAKILKEQEAKKNLSGPQIETVSGEKAAVQTENAEEKSEDENSDSLQKNANNDKIKQEGIING